MMLLALITTAFVIWAVMKVFVITRSGETNTESTPTGRTAHDLVTAENALLETFARWDNKAMPDAQRSKLLCQMFTRQELPAYITKEYTGNPELVRTLIAASVELRSVD